MSDDSDGTRSRGGLAPEDAFALVGHEVRQAILLALSTPNGDSLNTPVLSFSELYARVDPDVNTSNFNYHLQQLLGHFVEEREDDTAHLNPDVADEPGYALRPEGLLLTWIVRAGTTTTDATLDTFDAGFDCYHCNTRVEATYENGLFLIECPGCDYHYAYNPTPPGITHGTDAPADVLDRVGAYNKTVRGGVARGVCPFCANAVDGRFVAAADTNYPRRDLREVFIHRTCDHCGFIDYLTVGEYLLLRNTALISFCLAHDVDVTAGPLWGFEFAATDTCVTVEQTEPWAVSFVLVLDDETLEIRLDETLSATTLRR